jgi:hypothetical protein
MAKATQQPRVTLRIAADLYYELVGIAEVRDCTLQQALDFYLERVRQQAKQEALELAGMPKPKPMAVRPRKRKKQPKVKKLSSYASATGGGPNGGPGYTCLACGEKFRYERDWRKHALDKHPK